MLTTLFLHPEPPFDFELSVGMLGGVRKSLPDLYQNGVYKRVLHVGGKSALLFISSRGTMKKPLLRVEVYPHLSIQESESLRNRLHSMFKASYSYRSFRRVAKKDQLMNRISAKLAGLRPIPPPSVFEALVIAITEQQISLDAAIAIRSRLIEKYGDRLRFDGETFYAFPTAAQLAKAKPDQMRTVGLSRSKASYINELSKKVASGELDLERVRELDDETAVTELTKIKGIGRWSAEYALIRGLGRVNSLPADDLGIQRAVSQGYFRGRKVSSQDVRRALSKFAPYSGIAAFFLMYYLFWEPKPD
jgi:DNA-3-methyladenine glycosylase II